MRILKQVLSVALNDDGSLGAWSGSAEYDGASNTLTITLTGIASANVLDVLDGIEGSVAVDSGYGPTSGPSDGAAARAAESAMSAMAAGALEGEQVSAGAPPTPPADSKPLHLEREIVKADAAPPAETPVAQTETRAAASSTETAPSESPSSADEIAKAIDKAAKHKHVAEGSISLIAFVKLCAEHDEQARAELDASMGADAGCAATKAHVDRNSGYFPAYASKDDATRASRLIHTMRGIVSIKSQTS